MKTQFLLVPILIIGIVSCENIPTDTTQGDDIDTTDSAQPATTDYRDSVTGTYEGFRVSFIWTTSPAYDTSKATAILYKTAKDSTMRIRLEPACSSEDFAFKYVDGKFKCTIEYHHPTLTVTNDSLYFMYKPSLVPNYSEYFAKKVK